jgi:hypothetical protein
MQANPEPAIRLNQATEGKVYETTKKSGPFKKREAANYGCLQAIHKTI